MLNDSHGEGECEIKSRKRVKDPSYLSAIDVHLEWASNLSWIPRSVFPVLLAHELGYSGGVITCSLKP
jgi:hypothetical protein